MNDDDQPWFTQDTRPQAGLCLERHLIVGHRPADGRPVVALCGRMMLVGPPPEVDVDEVAFQAVRPCWHCHDVMTGHRPPPTAPTEPTPLLLVEVPAAADGALVAHLCQDSSAEANLLRTRCGRRAQSLLDRQRLGALFCGACLGASSPSVGLPPPLPSPIALPGDGRPGLPPTRTPA
ncbi:MULTISPECIES: hypothetical protein [Actinoalloteichus]|uniref:Uncharacterized protein n=1 Tax=Actinoalloteichus fjordicus TaxID=1612552 RepID=A0AAC9LGP4_9PSEU|nr:MULTISPECIES: hypothetical protein [Actinoalloteichus]APU16539.1 hypothetical protein UA74_22605 [Actinoalloteichus fjordicus]APU22607.1 hypothetical protein UA75_23125 [Actinoalloteichus sp. GBA129-24]